MERKDGLSLKGMIFISCLVHIAVLSLLFFTPSFPVPKMTFGPAYTVSLVSLPRNTLEQRSTSAVTKELMAVERRPEMVMKKHLEPAPEVPIHTIETRKKREPDLEKAMEEIRKKAAATTGASRQPPEKAAAGKAEKTDKAERLAGPATPAGQPGGAEMDAQMSAYYTLIWSRIKGKWALPQGILPGDVLEAVIDVTILRSGAVTEVKFEKRSGNSYFDDSALKAVQRANPLPPLPAWIGSSSVDVGIRFYSSALRS
jgi:colicin import membrane protein